MKKIFLALAVAVVALSSCRSLKEEWDPVFTFGPNLPAEQTFYTEATLPGFSGTWTTIKELKAMYRSKPLEIVTDIWIKGQVISTDITGNLYKELYIQDNTGGIVLKLGKSSLYSEYKQGQWIYVYCNGLTLGAYSGMPQLGLEADDTATNEYETSYIDSQAIINDHFFKGEFAEPLKPLVVSENDIKAAINAGYTGELWGKLVTVPGLKYGKEIFALLYPNSNLPHKSANPENRVFISDNGTWGVTTWALTKSTYIRTLQEGRFDDAEVGSGSTKYGPITGSPSEYLEDGSAALERFGVDRDLSYKEIMIKYAAANYVSHYFYIGKTNVQVRTSGFAKFADESIAESVRTGEKTCDITGIFSIYVSSSGTSAQMSLIDPPSESVKVN